MITPHYRSAQVSPFRAGERAWVYYRNADGTGAKLVIGKLQRMQGGEVQLIDNRDRTVRVALQEFSGGDQQLVVDQLCRGDRSWTDKSQQFHRNAMFARVDGNTVILKTKDKRELSVPFENLSAADQVVVRQLWKRPITGVPSEALPEPLEYLVGR